MVSLGVTVPPDFRSPPKKIMAMVPFKFGCTLLNLDFQCFPIYNLIIPNKVSIIEQMCPYWKDHCLKTDKVDRMNRSQMVQG